LKNGIDFLPKKERLASSKKLENKGSLISLSKEYQVVVNNSEEEISGIKEAHF